MAGKTVLITGCSAGGIGFALAVAFQKRGLTVIATTRSLSKMSELEKLPNVTLLELDVTSASSIAAAVEAVKTKTHGSLDILVNNSGRNYFMPVLDTDVEEARKLFDVNFWGVLATTQAFAPLLLETKGTVVNICSIVAFLNPPYQSKHCDVESIGGVGLTTTSGIYNASKAAMTLFSETLRLELAPLGVKVATVVTGSVTTNILTNGPKAELPESSRYLPIQERIIERGQGNDGYARMSSEEFAERVVKDILGGASGKIWRGTNATVTRLASIFMPTSMAVSYPDQFHISIFLTCHSRTIF